MCIVTSDEGNAWKYGRRLKMIAGAAGLASAVFLSKPALGYNIQLPEIGTTVYNVTVSNSNIDGGAVAEADNASFNNTTVINDFLAYAAAHGGGTVEIPKPSNGDYYATDELLIGNNTSLDVVTGATIENLTPKNTFIDTIAGTTQNVAIGGGGVINDNATSTGSNHMVILENIANLEVENVSIINSSQEHLVAENDTNVLINHVTITDSKIQSNTDGIDFSGSNFLIENCSIADGDDDIVAKPESTVCSNIYIQNIAITDGHGISIGGQTNAGLNGMYVNNVSFNPASSSSSWAIHLKAGDGNTTNTQNGGVVQNVTFNNITANNVDDVIGIDSYYNNGGSNYPSIPAPTAPNDKTEPFWENITIENTKVTTATGGAADIYGLNSSPADITGLNIINTTMNTVSSALKMYYASSVYFNNVTIEGTAIPDSLSNLKSSSGHNVSEEADDTFSTTANPIYTTAVPTLLSGSNDPMIVFGNAAGIVAVPEPGTFALGTMATTMLLARRRRRLSSTESKES
jgi:polygalacturonase